MSLVSPILSADVCAPARAGIRVLWAIDCRFVDDVVIDPETRTVTDVELSFAEEFKRIEFEEDTAFLEQEKSIIKSGINVVQFITIYEPGLSNDVRNALEDLNVVRCMHIIVLDNNGNYWYCGISYFPDSGGWQSEDMMTGEGYANTGADPLADASEYLETFICNSFNYALSTSVNPDELIGYADVWGTSEDGEVWGTSEDGEVWGT